jgi:hypothetical protein
MLCPTGLCGEKNLNFFYKCSMLWGSGMLFDVRTMFLFTFGSIRACICTHMLWVILSSPTHSRMHKYTHALPDGAVREEKSFYKCSMLWGCGVLFDVRIMFLLTFGSIRACICTHMLWVILSSPIHSRMHKYTYALPDGAVRGEKSYFVLQMPHSLGVWNAFWCTDHAFVHFWIHSLSHMYTYALSYSELPDPFARA